MLSRIAQTGVFLRFLVPLSQSLALRSISYRGEKDPYRTVSHRIMAH